jgi:hypothetical protein
MPHDGAEGSGLGVGRFSGECSLLPNGQDVRDGLGVGLVSCLPPCGCPQEVPRHLEDRNTSVRVAVAPGRSTDLWRLMYGGHAANAQATHSAGGQAACASGGLPSSWVSEPSMVVERECASSMVQQCWQTTMSPK